LTAEHDAASEALINAQTECDSLASEIEAVKASASSKAAEILASAGVPPLENVDDGSINSKNKTLQEFNALTPADRMNFVKTGGKIIN
jgi:hypothetical protein